MINRMLFVALIMLIVSCVGPVVSPAETPTAPPTYLNDCLPPAEQLSNVLPNPCFMGVYPYVYEKHTWEVPLQYRPIFIDGVGGESAAHVYTNGGRLIFDLTYFSGFEGLGFQQSLSGGQTYLLILRGNSTLRVADWKAAYTNFSAGGSISIAGVVTQLPLHSMGTPDVDQYGVPYWVMIGERTFMWGLYADSDMIADFEVGVGSNWKLGQHGSTFEAVSLSLIPVVWDGNIEDLVVIRH